MPPKDNGIQACVHVEESLEHLMVFFNVFLMCLSCIFTCVSLHVHTNVCMCVHISILLLLYMCERKCARICVQHKCREQKKTSCL